jgi:hypothetical protein
MTAPAVATTETDLQRLLTDAASLLGWSWTHFRPAQTAHGRTTPVQGPLGRGLAGPVYPAKPTGAWLHPSVHALIAMGR